MSLIEIKRGVQVIFDGTGASNAIQVLSDYGTMYTIMCSGTIGQTSTLAGSFDGVMWCPIVDFVVESDTAPLAATLEMCYPLLQVTGTARLQIARSH